MLLRLIRNSTHGNSVLGELYIAESNLGDQKICDTLENAAYLIPELIYPVHVTHSPKFGRLLPIIDHVSGRSGIRMHAGNRAADSEGCILLGQAQDIRLVRSREVVEMVTKMLLSIDQSREDIRIDITHYEPDYPGYPYTDYNPHHAAYTDANAVVCEEEP